MNYKYYKAQIRNIKPSYRISFGIICLLVCVIFSSCNSSFDITKRRYTKGYYIDRTGSKDITFVTKEKTPQVKIADPSSPPQPSAAERTEISRPIPTPTKNNTVIVAKDKKQSPKKAPVTNAEQITYNPPAISSLQTATPAPQNIADDGDHRSDRALSLFWLIIVIVLILWLIGIIAGGFGLGGLINILLVIALILLILWLLRIV